MGSQRCILLLLEGGYPWSIGGVSEWTHQYLQHSPQSRFIIVQLAAPSLKSSSLQSAHYPPVDNVIEFITVHPPEIERKFSNIIKWGKENAISLVDKIAGQVDIIHATNTGPAGLLGVELKNLLKKPLVITEHGVYFKEAELLSPSLKSGYKIDYTIGSANQTVENLKRIATLVYAQSDQVISVSKTIIPFQKVLGCTNSLYISNGVEASLFQNTDTHRYREEDRFSIGWIGRCAAIKRPLLFFDIVDNIREKLDVPVDASMFLSDAGESKLKEKVLKRNSNSSVKLYWNLSAAQYIEGWDALCLTSQQESQPLVLFEALARKALPFGWEVGDADNQFGLFYDPGTSISQLTENIIGYWKSKSRWKYEVEKRYQMVWDKYTWNHVFDQYENVFYKLNQKNLLAEYNK